LPAAAGVPAALPDRARTALTSKKLREFWKYTPVRDFLSDLAEVDVVRPVLTGVDQAGVTLTNLTADGLTYPLGPGDETSTERFPLADLAVMMSGDLMVLRVSGAVDAPVELNFETGLNVPVLILVEPDAKLKLIEKTTGDAFCNHSLYLDIGAGAEVQHASSALISDACHWSLTQITQGEESRYSRQQYQYGGRRRRTETQVLLTGRGATAEVTGAYVVDEGTHLDQQLVVEHRAPATTSRQKFHGIGAGKGTAIFNGRIHIHPGAPGSDAELSNKNLALHPEATINTKPELEIYTDDVKCAHGATIGQMSEDSLFYLRSRGLDPDQSRRMLCRAFINECIEGPLSEIAEHALLQSWAGYSS